MDQNQVKHQLTEPAINHHSSLATAVSSLTFNLVAKEKGVGVCRSGHAFPATIYSDIQGADLGEGGGVSKVPRTAARKGGERLCRGERHHVDCTIGKEMYKLTKRGNCDERARGLCRSERDHIDCIIGREMDSKTERASETHMDYQRLRQTADRDTDLYGEAPGPLNLSTLQISQER